MIKYLQIGVRCTILIGSRQISGLVNKSPDVIGVRSFADCFFPLRLSLKINAVFVTFVDGKHERTNSCQFRRANSLDHWINLKLYPPQLWIRVHEFLRWKFRVGQRFIVLAHKINEN